MKRKSLCYIYEMLCMLTLYMYMYERYQGLNFRARWQDLLSKFRNPVGKNHEDGRLLRWKILSFPKIFVFMQRNSPFSENSLIFIQH